MTIFFLFGFFLVILVLKNISVGFKFFTFFFTFLITLDTIAISKYRLIIEDEAITGGNDLFYILPFLPKSVTYRWDEIQKVAINASIFFEETALINIFPKDMSLKRPAIMIPFISGIPASAVQEILSHIPKNVEVRMDPALKKYIENPRKMYRYNVILGIIIVVVFALWTFWIFVFHNPLEGKKPDFRKAWERAIERTSEKYK